MDAAQSIPNPTVIPRFHIDPTKYPKDLQDHVRVTHKIAISIFALVAFTAALYTFTACPLWGLTVPVLVTAQLFDMCIRRHWDANRGKKIYSDQAEKMNNGLTQPGGYDLKAIGIVDKQGNFLYDRDHIITSTQMFKGLIQDVENISFEMTLAKYNNLESDFAHIRSREPLLVKLCKMGRTDPTFRLALQEKWLECARDERPMNKGESYMTFKSLMEYPQTYGFNLSPEQLDDAKRCYAKRIFEAFLPEDDSLSNTGIPSRDLLGIDHGREIFEYVPDHLKEKVNHLIMIFMQMEIVRRENQFLGLYRTYTEDILSQDAHSTIPKYTSWSLEEIETKVNEIVTGWINTKIAAFLENKISYFTLCKTLNYYTLSHLVSQNPELKEKIVAEFAAKGVIPKEDSAQASASYAPNWNMLEQEGNCPRTVYPYHARDFKITIEELEAKKYQQWHLKEMDDCLSAGNAEKFFADVTKANAAAEFTKKALDWGKENPALFLKHPELFRMGILSRDTQFEDSQTVGNLIDLSLAGYEPGAFFSMLTKVLENPENVALLFGENNAALEKLAARIYLYMFLRTDPSFHEQFLPKELLELATQIRQELIDLEPGSNSEVQVQEIQRKFRTAVQAFLAKEPVAASV